MTKEQKLEKLRKKIIKAVPDIMELKLGCYCEYIPKYSDEDDEFRGKFLVIDVDQDSGDIGWRFGYLKKEYCKILGRPITLEDVLITFEKKYKTLAYKEIIDLLLEWKFNKPLDQQPEEAIDFLYNLICKNKKDNH